MVCLYWAFRALIWFVITPSTALESWVRITFLFIHCFQNTLFLVVHKLNEVISVIIELWHAWLRQTQLPCIADKCVEILVSTLSILDNINGTSGPPLPPITMMPKRHVLAPSRLSSLPFFGGGGRGGRLIFESRAQETTCKAIRQEGVRWRDASSRLFASRFRTHAPTSGCSFLSFTSFHSKLQSWTV